MVAPVLSAPVEVDISDTTAEVSCVSDQSGGTLYCYVSTSATAPSAADLKAGTGAAFHTSNLALHRGNPPNSFTLESTLISDATGARGVYDAPQGVCLGADWNFFTQAAAVSNDQRIHVIGKDWVWETSHNADADGPGTHRQVNGMWWGDIDGTGEFLWVTANNYPTQPSLGWMIKYSVNATTGALTEENWWSLSEGGIVEYPFFDGVNWWFCHHDKHGLERYSPQFVYRDFFPFPDSEPAIGPEWQALQWFGNYVIVNLHEDGTPELRVYYFNGSAFTLFKNGISPPNSTCTQGFFRNGDKMVWVDRTYEAGGPYDYPIQQSSIDVIPIAGRNRFQPTGLSASTTMYYNYFLHTNASAEDSNILESGPWRIPNPQYRRRLSGLVYA